MSELDKRKQAKALAKIPEDISQLNLTLPADWLAQFPVEMSEGLVRKVLYEKILTQPIFRKFTLANLKEKDNGDYIVILQNRSALTKDWRTVDLTITNLDLMLPPS